MWAKSLCALFLLAAIASPDGEAIAATRSLAQRGGIDIDGNGKAQLLLRSADGTLQIGRLQNNGAFQFSSMAGPGPNFRIIGVADLNGNGKSDLVYQSLVSDPQQIFGDVHVWPDFVSASDVFLRSVKLSWLVQSVGDLDGDGYGDLVLRFTGDDGTPNDTGVSYIWFTNGNSVAQVRKRGGAPLSWSLLGAADINADGADDMVYIAPGGQIHVLMATAARTCANVPAGTLPEGYTALQVGDFSGRHLGDILMRNNVTGDVRLLTLSAVSMVLPPATANPDDPNASCTSTSLNIVASSYSLATADPTWQFFAAGDFNGDGITDIVWKKSDGTLVLWLMNANLSQPTVLANAGTAPAGYTAITANGTFNPINIPASTPAASGMNIASLSTSSANPFSALTITGTGLYQGGAAVAVRFIPEGGGSALTVPVSGPTATSLRVMVPTLPDAASGNPIAGAVDIQVVQVLGKTLNLSNTFQSLHINAPPAVPAGTKVGAITSAYLKTVLAVSNNTQTTLTAIPSLAAMATPTSSFTAQLQAMITAVDAITANPATSSTITTSNGSSLTLDANSLAQTDQLVQAIAAELAGRISASASLAAQDIAADAANPLTTAPCPTYANDPTANDTNLCAVQRFFQNLTGGNPAVTAELQKDMAGLGAGMLAGVLLPETLPYELGAAGVWTFGYSYLTAGEAPPGSDISNAARDTLLDDVAGSQGMIGFALGVYGALHTAATEFPPQTGIDVGSGVPISYPGGGMAILYPNGVELVTVPTAPSVFPVDSLALVVPPGPACSYTYSDWAACQSSNTQTRSVLTSSPASCSGTPVLAQACTYVPPAPPAGTACTYTYSAFGACQSNNTQTRTVLSSSPANCTGTPALQQSCTYTPSGPAGGPVVVTGAGGLQCTANKSCSVQLWSTVQGGTPPYHFAADSFANGAPPPGMTIGLDGTLSGTPSQAGTYTVAFCAIDLVGNQNCTTASVVVNPACTYTLSGSGQSFDATGGGGSITVTTNNSTCAWTAVSNSSFISITSGASGTGSGTAGYSVLANTSTSPRTGTITIGGTTYTVTEAGLTTPPASCVATSISFTGGPSGFNWIQGKITPATGGVGITCTWVGSEDGTLSTQTTTSPSGSFSCALSDVAFWSDTTITITASVNGCSSQSVSISY